MYPTSMMSKKDRLLPAADRVVQDFQMFMTRENYNELMERIDTYMDEFEENGTDHVCVDLDE